MNILISRNINCPYCGEVIEVLIDCSLNQQTYIEDCSVCCAPINFDVSVDENEVIVIRVTHENE